MESDGLPLRIEWFMLHSGYIRYFGKTIGLLADRGHAVHLAFTRIEKDPGDARLAHELADAHPNVTFGQASKLCKACLNLTFIQCVFVLFALWAAACHAVELIHEASTRGRPLGLLLLLLLVGSFGVATAGELVYEIHDCVGLR